MIILKEDLFVGEGNTVLTFEYTSSTRAITIFYADEEGYVKSHISSIDDVLTHAAKERLKEA